jgi:hypothetical protein
MNADISSPQIRKLWLCALFLLALIVPLIIIARPNPPGPAVRNRQAAYGGTQPGQNIVRLNSNYPSSASVDYRVFRGNPVDGSIYSPTPVGSSTASNTLEVFPNLGASPHCSSAFVQGTLHVEITGYRDPNGGQHAPSGTFVTDQFPPLDFSAPHKQALTSPTRFPFRVDSGLLAAPSGLYVAQFRIRCENTLLFQDHDVMTFNAAFYVRQSTPDSNSPSVLTTVSCTNCPTYLRSNQNYELHVTLQNLGQDDSKQNPSVTHATGALLYLTHAEFSCIRNRSSSMSWLFLFPNQNQSNQDLNQTGTPLANTPILEINKEILGAGQQVTFDACIHVTGSSSQIVQLRVVSWGSDEDEDIFNDYKPANKKENLYIRRIETNVSPILESLPWPFNGEDGGTSRFDDLLTDPQVAAMFSRIIDDVPPTSQILSKPSALTNNRNVAFTWTGTDAVSGSNLTYATRLDPIDSAFSAFATSTSRSATLSDGNYRFNLKAKDQAGNEELNAATWDFVVDGTPPQTQLSTTPPSLSNTTTATFTFSANEQGSTFRCNLDGAGFVSCASPKTYTNLAQGSHTFRVQAVDAAGNVDLNPPSFDWFIDSIAPAISGVSTSAITTNSATISWTTNEPSDTQVEYGTTTAYGNSKSDPTFSTNHSVVLSGLQASTTYHYLVRSQDQAGNLASWIDLTFVTSAAPGISIAVSPGSVTLTAGGSSQPVTVNVTRLGGYSGSVTLTLGALPIGVTGNVSQQPGTGNTGTITLTAASNATPVSNIAVGVSADGAGISSVSTQFVVSVSAAPGISIAVSPGSLTLTAGGSSQPVTVNVTRLGGYSGNVTLTLGALPIGVTGNVSQQPGTGNTGTITLTAASNATPVSNFSVAMTANGTGVSQASITLVLTVNAPTTPTASLDKSSLTFASQLVGTGSASQQVKLTNSGNATLSITSITLTGDFIATHTCGPPPTTLAAGTNCNLDMKFTPTAVGSRLGELSFSTNATGSPHRVQLSGTGVDFSVVPAAGSPTSMTIVAGQPTNFNLVFNPVSGLSGNASITCSISPALSPSATVAPPQCLLSTNSVTLSSNAVPFTLTFTSTGRANMIPQPPSSSVDWRRIWLFAWAGIVLTLMSLQLKVRPVRCRLVSVVAPACVVILLVALSACGGGGGTSGSPPPPPIVQASTPPGTYTITVSASLPGVQGSARTVATRTVTVQ